MNFRSIKDLYQDVWQNLHRLPRDIELVVGIPRSGMLPATLIALARNLPLADLDGYVAGQILSTGRTRQDSDRNRPGACGHRLDAQPAACDLHGGLCSPAPPSGTRHGDGHCPHAADF
jgi:hypothetical protein